MLFKSVPVVAGRGDCQSFQRDDPRGVFFFVLILLARRGFHQYLPGRVVGFAAIAIQFTAHFHQGCGYAFGANMASHQIDGIAFGDGRQIQLEATRLQCAM